MKINESKKQQTLVVDLGNLKPQWLAWCKEQGVSPSEATRQVITKLMQSPVKQTEPSPAIEQYCKREKRTHRKEIQLTDSENAQLILHSEAQGYSTTKFILACLRARFLKNPQLGQKELDGLTQSNLQLLSIGRNLNQIAKALNTVTIERPQFSIGTIEALRGQIKEHVKTVAIIIDASVERWSFKP